MGTVRAGGVRWRRFLGFAAPGTAAALGMVPAIALGWVTVGITSAAPIAVRTSGGTSASLTLVAGTDGRLTAVATGTGTGASMVELTDSRLDDLCLVPRIEVPVLGGLMSIKVATRRAVDVGRITLATSSADAGGIRLPETTIGYRSRVGVAGAPDSSVWVLGTAGESAELTDAELDVYGLELSDGFLIRSLRLGAGGAGLGC